MFITVFNILLTFPQPCFSVLFWNDQLEHITVINVQHFVTSIYAELKGIVYIW